MIAAANPMNKKYFPQLTGLRAVAALIVFVHHFAFAEEKVGHFIFRFQQELYIGVTIFFVLSGFLITLRYYEEKISLKQYAINRIARIYPMYLLITIVTFGYYYLDPAARFSADALGKHPAFSFFMNVTFLRGFFDELKFTGIAQGWTLTVEECFYFLAPLIFFLLRRKIKLVVVLIAFYCIGCLLVLLPKGNNSLGFFNSFQFMFIVTFFGRCLDFLIGVQLALWFAKRKKRATSKAIIFTVSGGLLVIATVFLLILPDTSNARYDEGLYTTPGLLINNWFLPFAVAILFWGLITEKTWFSKLLSTPLFELLGRSSYTFYLIHMGVISMLVVGVVQKWIFHLPVMLVISIILYKLIEEPMNNWIRRKSKNRNRTSKLTIQTGVILPEKTSI
jgi:peptidoglycan/LPS O-acetylase OafA/YrhL